MSCFRVPYWLEPDEKINSCFRAITEEDVDLCLFPSLMSWAAVVNTDDPQADGNLILALFYFSTSCNWIDRNQIQECPDNKLKQQIAHAFGCRIIATLIILLSMNMQIGLRWYFWGKSYPRCSLLWFTSQIMKFRCNCTLPLLLMSSMWEIVPRQ